jgi:FkbM family methyltransferase
MMSIKRDLANIAESALDVLIVQPRAGAVAVLFEELHLKQLFEQFGVDCVFDIGANAGQYAEKLRHRVGYQGAILSYEPNPVVALRLHQNAQNDPNWHVNEIALANIAGNMTFNIMTEDQYSSFLAPSERETEVCAQGNKIVRRIEVETHTLTQEFSNWSKQIKFDVPFLKMDTQGNDLAVAQGGEDVLHNFIGIQTELAVKRLYDGAPDFIESIKYFRSLGFELSAFVPNNEGHFPQLVEIDAILIRSDLMDNLARKIHGAKPPEPPENVSKLMRLFSLP